MAIDIKKPLKKILPHLLKAQEDSLNEADTVQRLIKVFENVLGYDTMGEITREKQIKDKYVDLALKIDGVIRVLVEAKSAGTILRDRHIEQAKHYAADGNIHWVILTNGVAWILYHLSFEEGIDYTRVFAVDLSEQPLDKAAELLSLLHRQSLKRAMLEQYWNRFTALNPESIAKVLFTEEALKFIRREIRRKNGILVDEEDLGRAIHDMFSTEARERIGPLKIRRKQKVRTKQTEVLKERSPSNTPLTSTEISAQSELSTVDLS